MMGAGASGICAHIFFTGILYYIRCCQALFSPFALRVSTFRLRVCTDAGLVFADAQGV